MKTKLTMLLLMLSISHFYSFAQFEQKFTLNASGILYILN
jgi:hypothetical protein